MADLLFVADDWRLTENGQIHEDSFGRLHDWSHAGRLGNWLTVNGKSGTEYTVRPGARVRLRCLNVANARVMAFDFAKLAPRVIAIDGQPLETPEALSDALVLAPGQRADLLFDFPDEVEGLPIREVSTNQPVVAASIKTAGPKVSDARPPIETVRLSANPLPSLPDLAGVKPVELRMDGGAMSSLEGATYKGPTTRSASWSGSTRPGPSTA